MSAPMILAAVAEELYDIFDGDRVGEWMRIVSQERSTSRWMRNCYLVVSKGDGYFGIAYSLGLTENQEHDFPWAPLWSEKPREIKLTPLFSEQVTTTVYRDVKP